MHKSCTSLSFLATLAQTPDFDYGHKEAAYCFAFCAECWGRLDSRVRISFIFELHLFKTVKIIRIKKHDSRKVV